MTAASNPTTQRASRMSTERERTWEHRIFTALQAVVVVVIGWGLNAISNSVAGMTKRVEELSVTVTRIEERVAHAMLNQSTTATAQQARDGVQDKRIDDLRRDVSDLQYRTQQRREEVKR